MTDRAKAFIVHLDDDYRIGDGTDIMGADAIGNAIKMIRGVTKVEPVVGDYDHRIAVERATSDLRSELRDLLWPKS